MGGTLLQNRAAEEEACEEDKKTTMGRKGQIRVQDVKIGLERRSCGWRPQQVRFLRNEKVQASGIGRDIDTERTWAQQPKVREAR